MKKLIFALACFGQIGFAQAQSVSLEQCQQWSRENFPVLKQKEMIKEISDLKQKNLKTNYLPVIDLKAQATYQSDVTKVEIPFPNIDIPEVSKDQYKAYFDLRQTVWDGGVTKSASDLEDIALELGLQQVEVELYALKQYVNDAFFAVLILNENIKMIKEAIKVLESKLLVLESGLRNGVIEENNLDYLKAEILKMDQQLILLDEGKNVALAVLSHYTGQNLNSETDLKTPEVQLHQENSFLRPEFAVLRQNKLQLDMISTIKNKARYPKVFAFGQAGYGKPALNMFMDDFDSYYLLGLGVSWNVFDWKKTTRENQIIELQKHLVDNKEEELKFKLNLLLQNQLKELDKLNKLVESDENLVRLHQKISTRSASKLENGTITSSDYLQDLNAVTTSQINLETRKLKQLEAIIKYNTIKGF